MLETACASLYRDPGAFQLERSLVFGRSWQFLAHESDLVDEGDYAADTLAGFPIVVVRNKDGALRGFHNVCRHRAGPLVADERGRCAGEFVCRYHGWRYTLDGRLRSAVGFGPSEGFDPRQFNLHPIRVESWRGFVFVNLHMAAAPLLDTLAPLEAVWAQRDIAVPAGKLRRSHRLACNWKVYVENYLEGYHVSTLHPGLAAEIDTDGYRVTMNGAVAIHEAPSRAGGSAVNEGLWAWIWPNMAVNVYRHGLMIEHMKPDGVDGTRLDYLFFHEQGGGEALDQVLAMSDRTTAEDAWLCERVQQNLSAGIYERGVLSPRHENAVAWFQARIAETHA
jgi:choline monooxygenase